jgi:catechol 2,3-dioxygenase-like lactoylglutathione lyase family enzyme
MAEGTGAKKEPLLKLKYLSHGTLETRDLEKSRRFYQEFLGLEVVRTSPVSLMIRLGGNHTIAVVHNPRKPEMRRGNHNGLDVETRAEVDHCYKLVTENKDAWELKSVIAPRDAHGTYSFYFVDFDDNWWEILTNPAGGYSWMFGKGRDIDSWGAGEETGFNPNDFTRRLPPGKKTAQSAE